MILAAVVMPWLAGQERRLPPLGCKHSDDFISISRIQP